VTVYGRTNPGDPGEPSTGQRRVSVTEVEAAVLTALCINKRVIEIGTGLGVSTEAIAATASEVVTVDIDPWVQREIVPALEELPNVTCITDRDIAVGPFDIGFVDGDHREHAVRADVHFMRRMRCNMIVVHDARDDTVRSALDGMWVTIPTEYGLAVQTKT
jgi:predicted O-methyltransferase YrrM